MFTGIALAYLYPQLRPNEDYLVGQDGWKWLHSSTPPTTQEIAAAVLPARKALRIEADRQECQARIYSVWPLAKQISLGLGGVYNAADAADCAVWVNANIDASNAARDIINAESTDTPEKIAAVVVAWPTYTGG
jgi:hypothetical protein